MRIARPLQRLIESFEKLPGIGPKTAQRLSYYLLHVPQNDLEEFGKNLSELKKLTVLCSICKNVSEEDPCEICTDINRDKNLIMVVEQPLDIFALERTGRFNGMYHVLHGAISPMENIGPDEIFVQELINRIKERKISEVIIATNPTMEGDATAMYIAKQLKIISEAWLSTTVNLELKISRLGMGVPTGADLEYADEVTLRQAIEGRRTL